MLASLYRNVTNLIFYTMAAVFLLYFLTFYLIQFIYLLLFLLSKSWTLNSETIQSQQQINKEAWLAEVTGF